MPADLEARRAPTWLFWIAAASLLPWSWFVNLWFVPRELYKPLHHASGGLLNSTVQVCLPSVGLYLLLFRAGSLRPMDVAWRKNTWLRGVGATLVLWTLCNLIALSASGMEWKWNDEPGQTWQLIAGRLLGQLLGNALWEETVYRGFFFVQFVLLLRSRCMGTKRSAWLAAFLSAVIFALPHIPNRVLKDEYHVASDVIFDQMQLLASGMFLAWVFLRTRNLWWCVGLHSLANCPTLLFAWSLELSTKEVSAALGLALTLVWPWTFGRRESPGQGHESVRPSLPSD